MKQEIIHIKLIIILRKFDKRFNNEETQSME